MLTSRPFKKAALFTCVALLFLSGLAAHAADGPVVSIQTNKGEIKVQLDPENAPLTVENFMQYVTDGFYDGTVFHRVIDGFMIQGGGFTENLQKKPTRDTIKNEAANGLTNKRGTISMARRNDPHSASAQWFINHADNGDFLDQGKTGDGWGYAVFGEVISGMEVVDEIAKSKTGKRIELPGSNDVPLYTVLIEKVTVVD